VGTDETERLLLQDQLYQLVILVVACRDNIAGGAMACFSNQRPLLESPRAAGIIEKNGPLGRPWARIQRA